MLNAQPLQKNKKNKTQKKNPQNKTKKNVQGFKLKTCKRVEKSTSILKDGRVKWFHKGPPHFFLGRGGGSEITILNKGHMC